MKFKPVVIVTGASRGLGAATARWLARTGTAVSLVARSQKELRHEADAIERSGGDCLFVPGDVSDPRFCRSAVEKTLARFHRLDALVNNAGTVEPMQLAADARPADWHYNIAVNLLGPVYMSMAAIPDLRHRNGRIVNVSSGAAHSVIVAASAYCAAKAALNQFSRVLAAEEPDLTVIAVRPGVVDTRMQELLRSDGPAKMPPEQAAYYRNLKTAGRLEPPQVPARSVAWLALNAPREWSGDFMSYDDPQIAEPALAAFGANCVT
jgi:NAD(P)-dependent dehydrogenase (short-subunit alcohol dehydrogenase family)